MKKYFLGFMGIFFFLMLSYVNDVEAAKFKDISGHWSEQLVDQAVEKGYIDGYPDGTFRPDAKVTRAEFVKMLVSALNLPLEEAKGEWYAPYVKQATDKRWYQAKDFGESAWNAPLTRMDLARIAARSLNSKWLDKTDAQLMYDATRKGIITGMANGELAPNETSTRAQAAVVIERILAVMNGQTLEVDKRAQSYAEVAMSGTNIRTMWGINPQPLPKKIEMGYNLDAEVDQMLIIDMDDPNGAYRSMFPKVDVLYYGGRRDSAGAYLIALHLNIENKKDQGEGYMSLARTLSIHGGAFRPVRAIIPKEAETETVKNVPLMWLNEVQKVDGWMLYAVPKEEFEAAIEQEMYFGVMLDRINSSARTQYLTASRSDTMWVMEE